MSSGEDQALSAIYLILCLILVGSALMVRRIPIGQAAKMVLAWALIFGAAFIVFALRDDFRALGGRLMAEVTGKADVAKGEGGELRLRRQEDGHFWVDAKLNGETVRFLVDSGATVTTISPSVAEAAGIERRGNDPLIMQTANGMAEAWRGRAERLEVGALVRQDFPVHIAEGLGDTNLLGMNFLSSLDSWRVEGQWLVLKP